MTTAAGGAEAGVNNLELRVRHDVGRPMSLEESQEPRGESRVKVPSVVKNFSM
jgi:hypothetical protein